MSADVFVEPNDFGCLVAELVLPLFITDKTTLLLRFYFCLGIREQSEFKILID